MREIAVGILGVLFAGSSVGHTQQPVPPTFRAGTTLVDFTIVAVDARGNPVTDLRKDEISITEDDAARDAAFFQFEGASAFAASALGVTRQFRYLRAHSRIGAHQSTGVSDQSFGSTKGGKPSQNTLGVTVANHTGAVERGRVEGTGELIAAITGGRVIRNNNDLTEGLRAASHDLRGTYSVGFYAVNNPDNGWHRLQVRVSRPGVTLRHRQGYLAASAAVSPTQEWSEEQWNDLAYRPLISTAVRLAARATVDAGTLKVSLDVASDDLAFRKTDTGLVADVDVAAVENTTIEPTNVRVQSASIDVAGGAALPTTVAVASEFTFNPQTATVRIIVRDRSTGRYGSVDLPMAALR